MTSLTLTGYRNACFAALVALTALVPSSFGQGLVRKVLISEGSVEVHQVNAQSSDLSFDFEVSAEISPTPRLPVVSITATSPQTGEPSPTTRFAPAEFTIQLSEGLGEPLLVFFDVSGSAEPKLDYNEVKSPVQIPAGARELKVVIGAIGDDLIEGDETVVVRLSEPLFNSARPYQVDPEHRSASVVIHDSTPLIKRNTVSIETEDPEATETLMDQNFADFGRFQVRRDGNLDEALQVFLEANGTATFKQDYILSHGDLDAAGLLSVRFLAGTSAIAIDLYPQDDVLSEGDETIKLRIVPSPAAGLNDGYLIDADHAEATVVLHDNDSPSTRSLVSISATGLIAEETAAPLRRIRRDGEFTISRTGPTSDPIAGYLHFSGSADPRTDVEPIPFLFNIPAGASTVTIPVKAVADDTAEGIETFRATLSECPPTTNPPIGAPCRALNIDPAHDNATVYVRDDGITTTSLLITDPAPGARFDVGSTIQIEAEAIDLEGYISRVEFWDGEKRLGVSEIVFIRAPDPGTPLHHSFQWVDPELGEHVITARAADSTTGKVFLSPAVAIVVGRQISDQVVLGIEAIDSVASEVAANNKPDPAVFQVTRVAGTLEVDITASYSLEGTAINGVDYDSLPGKIELKSGQKSAQIVIHPVPDKAREGDETVVVRLEPSVCILIFPPPAWCYLIQPPGQAKAVIHEGGITENQSPRVTIVRPKSQAELPVESPVEIVSEARDPDGWVGRVEFFADEEKIGESNIQFIRPPDPGQLQTISFTWRHPNPGRHSLTAKATDDRGATSLSEPVIIRIGLPEPATVITVATRDAFAVEPSSDKADPSTGINTASFVVRRTGSQAEDLVVGYSLHGSAENGKDYLGLPGSVTIPKGASQATVLIKPQADRLEEWVETVILKIEPSADDAFRLGQPSVAVALIGDEEALNPFPTPRCFSLPGGFLDVCFPSQGSATYRVEASEDLLTWETLQTGVDDAAEIHVVDEEARGLSRRFYRLIPE